MLDFFYFTKYKFYIKFIEEVNLPEYKGSTLRGGSGYILKEIVCTLKYNQCDECLIKKQCPYSYLFLTPIQNNSKMMKKYKEAPHPFVIEPDFDLKTNYKKIEILNFNILLIGKAAEYLPYLVLSYYKLVEKGIGKEKAKYELIKVTFLNNGNEIEIYNNKEKKLKNINASDFKFKTLNYKNISKIKLKFITPTRLKYNNKITSNIEFHIIIRNLLRRISALSYFHCDKYFDVDYKNIIENSKNIKLISSNIKWYDWSRYSTRQKSKMHFGGFIGEAWYEGPLEQFIDYLLLGSEIHIGKNSTFGLGKYEVELIYE